MPRRKINKTEKEEIKKEIPKQDMNADVPSNTTQQAETLHKTESEPQPKRTVSRLKRKKTDLDNTPGENIPEHNVNPVPDNPSTASLESSNEGDPRKMDRYNKNKRRKWNKKHRFNEQKQQQDVVQPESQAAEKTADQSQAVRIDENPSQGHTQGEEERQEKSSSRRNRYLKFKKNKYQNAQKYTAPVTDSGTTAVDVQQETSAVVNNDMENDQAGKESMEQIPPVTEKKDWRSKLKKKVNPQQQHDQTQRPENESIQDKPAAQKETGEPEQKEVKVPMPKQMPQGQKDKFKKNARQNEKKHTRVDSPEFAPAHVEEKRQIINPDRMLSFSQKANVEIRHFLNKVEDFFSSELTSLDRSRIVCAVSGGVDSIVLLDTLAILHEKYNYNIYVAHFNHNLRGKASDDDEAFVKMVAESYNLPFFSGKEDVKYYADKNSLSIEQAARKLRYKFLENVAKNVKAGFIMTAHTSDDMVETFFMNLFRGSGLTGLSGIPSKRVLSKSLTLARPFLKTKKLEIIGYAEKRGISWREDESNSLTLFLRNKIRHDLLPKIAKDFSPSVLDVINRTMGIIRGADRFITERVSHLMKVVVTDKRNDRIALQLSSLLLYNDFVKGELIQTAIIHNFKIQPVSLHAIDRILSLVDSPIGSVAEVSKKIYALRDREEIIIAKKSPVFKFNMLIDRTGEYTAGNYRFVLTEMKKEDMTFTNNPNVEYFDLDTIPHYLFIRSWEYGDSFSPLGMYGTMKVSDFLTNKKVPLIDKHNILVLATKNEIVWVCGMRISEKFKVTHNTTKVLKAELIEINR